MGRRHGVPSPPLYIPHFSPYCGCRTQPFLQRAFLSTHCGSVPKSLQGCVRRAARGRPALDGPAAESTLRGSRWSPVPHPQSGSLACSTTPIPPTRPSGSSLWVGRAGSHRMEARYSVVRTLVTRCQGVKGSRRGKLRPFSTPLYSSCWEEEASSHQACPLAQSLPSFRFLM